MSYAFRVNDMGKISIFYVEMNFKTRENKFIFLAYFFLRGVFQSEWNLYFISEEFDLLAFEWFGSERSDEVRPKQSQVGPMVNLWKKRNLKDFIGEFCDTGAFQQV